MERIEIDSTKRAAAHDFTSNASHRSGDVNDLGGTASADENRVRSWNALYSLVGRVGELGYKNGSGSSIKRERERESEQVGRKRGDEEIDKTVALDSVEQEKKNVGGRVCDRSTVDRCGLFSSLVKGPRSVNRQSGAVARGDGAISHSTIFLSLVTDLAAARPTSFSSPLSPPCLPFSTDSAVLLGSFHRAPGRPSFYSGPLRGRDA